MAMRGILLESSVVDGSASVEKLLFRLGYSNLYVVRTTPLSHSVGSAFPLSFNISINVGSERQRGSPMSDIQASISVWKPPFWMNLHPTKFTHPRWRSRSDENFRCLGVCNQYL